MPRMETELSNGLQLPIPLRLLISGPSIDQGADRPFPRLNSNCQNKEKLPVLWPNCPGAGTLL